jgi:hypothetical protein
MDSLQAHLKALYPSIIRKTIYRTPENYDIIEFEQFLDQHYHRKDLFIPPQEIAPVRALLIATFGNERSCFPELGVLQQVAFTSMHYYQAEIGINGPRHSGIDEPVCILQVNQRHILWNGYHRALSKMARNYFHIQGFVLALP